jgi:hypothetical protein
MPSGEHRIEQEHIRSADIHRQPIIIADRPERFRIAVQTDMADARLRSHPQNSIQHSETGPENGDKNYRLFEHRSSTGSERRFHLNSFRRPAPRRFGEKQNSDLLNMTAKHVGRGGPGAQNRKPDRDKRMVGDSNLFRHPNAPSRIRTGEAGILSSTIRRSPS